MFRMYDLILEARSLLNEWKKTADGFEMEYRGSTAKLFKKPYKRSTRWYISYKGKDTELGKKASFDHAEGVLAKS
jgi:hypothetical protein